MTEKWGHYDLVYFCCRFVVVIIVVVAAVFDCLLASLIVGLEGNVCSRFPTPVTIQVQCYMLLRQVPSEFGDNNNKKYNINNNVLFNNNNNNNNNNNSFKF